jgi:hypothetical protein
MSNKELFQEILSGIRSDLTFVKSVLFQKLVKILQEKDYCIDQEIKIWIFDVFLDKVYEIDAKIDQILADFDLKEHFLPVIDVKQYAERLIFERGMTIQTLVNTNLNYLYEAIENYERAVEDSMTTLRRVMYARNWKFTKQVEPAKYVLPTRRKTDVKARDELEKAKQAVKDQKWEEVFNHLRPAIDLALKEKFGFSKIHPMKQFLADAEKHNLPLPSYSMAYDYFDEGSQRIHGGKLHTPWECEKALSFVAEFIDRLDLVEISKGDVDEFRKRSNTVEYQFKK